MSLLPQLGEGRGERGGEKKEREKGERKRVRERRGRGSKIKVVNI